MKNIVLILCLLSIHSCVQDRSGNKFKHLYDGKHGSLGIQLLTDRSSSGDTDKYYLRIFKKDASFSVHEYLSFKNEPYLSNSIAFICTGDTLHPIATQTERAYEAGNEIVYLMIFAKRMNAKCISWVFEISNFASVGDTLKFSLKK